jgi:aspartate aminotransferase
MDAITRGKTKYTAVDGIPELRKAICAKFKRENGLDYEPGSSHRRHRRQADPVQRADGDAEPGRRGGHPRALLGQLSRHGAAGGGTPVFADHAGDRLQADARTQLEAAITPKTKWLIFNSPSNPTGAAYTARS